MMAELLPIYIGELHEHVKLVTQELLSLESETSEERRQELLESIFRTVHSLKGASRSVGLATAASVCHEMENIFAAMQEGAPMETAGYQLIFKTLDLIESMGQLLQTGDKNAERPLAPVLFLLKEAAIKATDTNQSPPNQSPPNQSLPNQSPPNQSPTNQSPPHQHITDPAACSGRDLAEGAPLSAALAKATADTTKTGTESSSWAKTVENSVRLPVAKLDGLLAESSDLITVTNRNLACLASVNQLHLKLTQWQRMARQERTGDYERLQLINKDLEQIKHKLQNENRHLSGAVSTVTSSIRSLRMVPTGRACQGIDRMVRDLTADGGGAKQVQLKFSGMEIEVDRNVLEQLKDPLLHLVRNACDHGVETTEERLQAGKTAKATITIEATVQGSQAMIKVSDDGRGVDLAKIKARAEKLNLPPPENDTEINNLLFSRGFSTAPIITEISGRGVGLDVVKDKIEHLHGSVELESASGAGSVFTMTVPLTLTSMRVLFVRCGGQLFALPTSSIQKLVRFSVNDLHSMDGRTVISLDQAPVTVVTLNQILDLQASNTTHTKIPAVVLSLFDSRAVVVVDELVAEQEVLVKNLGDRIRKVKHIAASTIMPSGQIALIVNSAEVLRSALSPGQETMPSGTEQELRRGREKKRRLLLVDDSITTRSLEKHLLESAGFDVTTCVDGAQAWQTIQEKQFDLIVSDVEMPKMDGFALTTKIKTSVQYMKLPVVLVTALASEKHKAMGIASGADAYLVKSEVERSDLLEVINQLI